ncbi:protein-lysine N-methyltransferase NDAI_0H00150 [Naumovozyma dairenensis CBS 421]|uniref:SET domain-containing protein n=1 Tax=Naumovozyma dairenensis (strain ATCC 10597 / BCRC 20456 / CBS 421 / NBRC 0211 / NRRL Y-12639) TaxID=1071378 RepID=G0WEH8_NAUDC|nr:hypothetical protein NDAI_0H00150 [Naumovozyma dairenensis CBS 421]CCD26189.1 hypothetical protein NDAI_0H00150 [Naumovozyma dairenensis CBS 421]
MMISGKKYDDFFEWCKANNCFIDDRISFKFTDSAGITAYANSSIPIQQTPLISVPTNLLLTYQNATDFFNWSIAKGGNLPTNNPNAITQLYLSHLKLNPEAKKSQWDKYVEILSLDLNQPYFWTVDQLQQLKGTDLYIKIQQDFATIIQEYIELLQILKVDILDQEKLQTATISHYINSHLPTLLDGKLPWNHFVSYLWSHCIFKSRAFPQLLLNNAGSDVGNINLAFLFPIVDLLNHKNDVVVKWESSNDINNKNDNKVLTFITQETLHVGDQIFNNYGNKSNEELLLGYGFIQENNNNYDYSELTLKLNEETINESLKFCDLQKHDNIVKRDCVSFELNTKEPIPDNLLKFFGFLSKLQTEQVLTLRSILDGSDELYSILLSKLDFFKNHKLPSSNLKPYRLTKQYFNCQRKIFQNSIDYLLKIQKSILKENNNNLTSNLVSFKTILKNDEIFLNSLLQSFGITNFDDIIQKDFLKQSLLLWIVRMSNIESYPSKEQKKLSSWDWLDIQETFREVANSIVIEKEDVMEFIEFYTNAFPKLSNEIPEVYDKGDWKIKQFIIADTVMDILVWTRKLTNEPFFIKKQQPL